MNQLFQEWCILNIFYLDKDPIVAAKSQCDKHIVKMPLESAQMLCTAHRVLDNIDVLAGQHLYKATHINHPSSIWVRENKEHYMWLYEHFIALCQEYTNRYGKQHLCFTKFNLVLSHLPKNLPYSKFVDPPTCMPDYCKVDRDTVSSYRKYYVTEKRHIAEWKTKKPEWYEV